MLLKKTFRWKKKLASQLPPFVGGGRLPRLVYYYVCSYDLPQPSAAARLPFTYWITPPHRYAYLPPLLTGFTAAAYRAARTLPGTPPTGSLRSLAPSRSPLHCHHHHCLDLGHLTLCLRWLVAQLRLFTTTLRCCLPTCLRCAFYALDPHLFPSHRRDYTCGLVRYSGPGGHTPLPGYFLLPSLRSGQPLLAGGRSTTTYRWLCRSHGGVITCGRFCCWQRIAAPHHPMPALPFTCACLNPHYLPTTRVRILRLPTFYTCVRLVWLFPFLRMIHYVYHVPTPHLRFGAGAAVPPGAVVSTTRSLPVPTFVGCSFPVLTVHYPFARRFFFCGGERCAIWRSFVQFYVRVLRLRRVYCCGGRLPFFGFTTTPPAFCVRAHLPAFLPRGGGRQNCSCSFAATLPTGTVSSHWPRCVLTFTTYVYAYLPFYVICSAISHCVPAACYATTTFYQFIPPTLPYTTTVCCMPGFVPVYVCYDFWLLPLHYVYGHGIACGGELYLVHAG